MFFFFYYRELSHGFAISRTDIATSVHRAITREEESIVNGTPVNTIIYV